MNHSDFILNLALLVGDTNNNKTDEYHIKRGFSSDFLDIIKQKFIPFSTNSLLNMEFNDGIGYCLFTKDREFCGVQIRDSNKKIITKKIIRTPLVYSIDYDQSKPTILFESIIDGLSLYYLTLKTPDLFKIFGDFNICTSLSCSFYQKLNNISVISFDNDDAGIKSMKKLANFNKYSNTMYLFPKNYKDINELICSKSDVSIDDFHFLSTLSCILGDM